MKFNFFVLHSNLYYLIYTKRSSPLHSIISLFWHMHWHLVSSRSLSLHLPRKHHRRHLVHHIRISKHLHPLHSLSWHKILARGLKLIRCYHGSVWHYICWAFFTKLLLKKLDFHSHKNLLEDVKLIIFKLHAYLRLTNVN